MELDKILNVAVRGGASDVILKAGTVPKFRYNGQLIPLGGAHDLSDEQMQTYIMHMLPQHLHARLAAMQDLDFAYQTPSGLRFRVNLFRQRQHPALVMRVIHNHIRTVEELLLPHVVQQFATDKRGIILITGATGSGKSTTLASIIEKINTTRPAHVITIEDPIEVIFREKMATIQQREVGVDCESFGSALRSALRQNPDVILVGELRDKETIETALMAAETGHLVMGTLHTIDAVETMTRLLSYFPSEQHLALRSMLSQTLRAIVSQRLVARADQKGMVAAMEVLIGNERVREEIKTGESFLVFRDIIEQGGDVYGMQSFDQSLLDLFNRQLITIEEALQNATRPRDLELAAQGITQ